MGNTSFELLLFGFAVLVEGEAFASFDVVCNEFGYRVWNVCLVQFIDKGMDVHSVEGLAEVQGDNNGALGGS